MRRSDFLSTDLAEAIRAHARACYPQEALGVITPDGYRPMENRHPEPEQHGQYDDATMRELIATDQLLGIVHSHPNGPNAPSKPDMALQVQLHVPAVICSTNGDACLPLVVWGDMFEPDPLEGRGFIHGVTDCYELCRDWYYLEEGVRPPPVPRSWAWWNHDKHLVDELYGPSGFTRIVAEDVERGCIALCSIGRAKTPNHGLMYLGDGLVLNHCTSTGAYDPTRLSRIEPLARWVPYITRWLKPNEDRKAIWEAGEEVRR